MPSLKMSDLKRKQEALSAQDTTTTTLLSTSSELIKTAELWHTLKMIIKECNANKTSSVTDRITMLHKTFLAMKIKLEDYDTDQEIETFLVNLVKLLSELKKVEFEEVTVPSQQTQQTQQIQQDPQTTSSGKVDLDDVQKMILEAFNN